MIETFCLQKVSFQFFQLLDLRMSVLYILKPRISLGIDKCLACQSLDLGLMLFPNRSLARKLATTPTHSSEWQQPDKCQVWYANVPQASMFGMFGLRKL